MFNHSQQLTFKVFQPELGKLPMNILTSRSPETQKINAQYPCVATNLGEDTMCFHINLNQSNPKALIYENQIEGDKGEYFLDFLELNDFKDLGIDETFINLDTCSRFVYLTRSIETYTDKDKAKKSNELLENGDMAAKTSSIYYNIWINVMIIDPFNRVPQVAHFKSSKVFRLYNN